VYFKCHIIAIEISFTGRLIVYPGRLARKLGSQGLVVSHRLVYVVVLDVVADGDDAQLRDHRRRRQVHLHG
jgi:hypothetical protein